MSQLFILLILLIYATLAHYIRCYQCEGGQCDVIRSNTNWVRCPLGCCIWASSYGPQGLINMRKCAVARGACDRKCDVFKRNYAQSHPVQRVISCESCDSDMCNSPSFEQTVRCYSCRNCNKVFSDTPTVQCPSFRCCYMIWVADSSQQQYTVDRGCLSWQPGDDCSDVCERMKGEHLGAHPGGSFDSCRPCQKSEPMCNRATYKPQPSINCYECSGKKCFASALYKKVRCVNDCCFSASIYGRDGWNYIRKCASTRKGCRIYCSFLKKSLKAGDELIECTRCNTNLCNNEAMKEPFKCYSCKNCRAITSNSRLIECRGPQCCFTAYVQDNKTKPLFAIRGCSDRKKCFEPDICKQLRLTRTKLFPAGKFDKCFTCNPRATSGCNRAVYDPPTIKCYQCRGERCNKIYPNTTRINCANLCCLSLANYGITGLINTRKCADLIIPCDSYCSYYTKILRKNKSREENIKCISCKNNFCNKQLLLDKFKCYQCHKCNRVTKKTKMVECQSRLCCYTAFLQDKPNVPLFASRGCIKWKLGLKCTSAETCASLKNEHLKDHPQGHVDGCKTCKPNDVTGCNKISYQPPLMCYECEGDCEKVTNMTRSIKCPGRCCYWARIYSDTGYGYVRKCSEHRVPCKSVCSHYTVQLQDEQKDVIECKSCAAFNCNNDVLKPAFKCYECNNCNNISSGAKLIDCYDPKCCYVAYIKDNVNNIPFAIRGCAKENVGGHWSCHDICKNFSKQHGASYAKESVEKCVTCQDGDTSGCNNAVYIPSAMCYSCEGDNCNDVEINGTAVVCPKQCCMSASIFRGNIWVNIRACGELPCNEYCTKFTENNVLRHPGNVMLQCHTCEQYQCNKNVFQLPFKCYECRHCDSVTNDTIMVDCRYPNCCYTAKVKDIDDEEYFNIRGCYKGNCSDTCNEIERMHFLAHPNGDFESCMTCSDGNSNNQPILKGWISSVPGVNSVICYNCRHCSRVTSDTPTTHCPEDRCCYRVAVKDDEDDDVYIIRGCAHLKQTQTCENTCEYISRKHMLGHPKGYVHACIQCIEGDSDNCNDVVFNLPHTTHHHMQPLMCYDCRKNCDKVTGITPNIQCSSAKCCYTAYLTDTSDDDDYFAVRGCAEWKPGSLCDNTCNDVKKEHSELYPNGKFRSCQTCQNGDSNECNNQPYEETISTHQISNEFSIRCYSCRNCNEVTSVTPTVDCPSSKCCYRAIIKSNAAEMFFAIRGCLKLKRGQVCDDTCQILKEKHMGAHPVGAWGSCIRCKEGDQHKCNDIRFNPPDNFIKSTTCFECRNCSKPSIYIPTVECKLASCCYTAYLNDHKDQALYVVRGCVKYEQTCINTCLTVKNDHLWAQPMGVFIKCLPCLWYDSDNCNNHIFDVSSGTNFQKPDFMNTCYVCKNCSVITHETPTIYCPHSKCCYSAYARNTDYELYNVMRGCARKGDELTCEDACEEARNEHFWMHPYGDFGQCMTCDEGDVDKCNTHFQERYLQKVFVPTAMCYECNGCNTVSSITNTVPCVSAKCCYTSLLRDKPGGSIYVIRGCADDKNCTSTCQTANRQFLSRTPEGQIEYCSACNEDTGMGCNSNNYNPQPTIETTTPIKMSTSESGMCYECRDCNKVTNSTPTVYCPFLRCCYTALIKDNQEQEIFAVRGCIQQLEDCVSVCNTVKNYHAIAHANGTLNFCVTCDSNDDVICNRHEYTKRAPQYPYGHQNIFICYDCIGCSTVNKDTPTQACPENCCYTMVWTENGVTNVARLCAQLNETNCDDHCNEVSADIKNNDIKSEIHQCHTCKTENCNSHPVTMPETSTTTVVTVAASNICYRCRDCGLISETTPQIRCPTNCCYETQQLDESGLVIIRGCARIVPGKQCKHYCNDIEASYCNSCNTSYCNNITLNKPITTPISVLTCYDCIGCSSVNKDTRTQACPENCCYTMVWTEYGVTNVARLCAQLNGTNCDDHCNEVSADIKNNDIKSEIHQCQSCKTENCNSHPVTMPETSTTTVVTVAASNICYRCRDCGLISQTTPQIRCPTNCCYETQQLDESGLVIIRGCARIVPGKQCKHYCNDIKASYCNSCNTSYCNNITLNKPITTPISVLTCYDCIGCSSVNKDTRTQACPENCCYTMVWTEYGVTNVARLCAQLNGTNCDDHCNEVSADIKNNDIKSEIHQCQSCKTENCNSHPVTMPETSTTTVVTVAASNICYRCCDCELISETTPQIRCPTNCCYETQELDETGLVIFRGCARIVPGKQCKHYCNDIKASYCNSCNTSYCNNITLNKPITTPISVLTCYDCIGCSSVNKDTRTQACPENCCYTMVWTENGVTNVARLCAQLNGTNCDDHCNEVSADIKNHDIKSEIHQCQTCKTENCNSHPVTMPETSTATVVTVPPSNICYRCRDCGLISETTPQIRCLTNCCYETQQLDESGLVIIRGCARIVPGKQCKHYCNDIKASYCNSCNTSYCNNITLNKPITTPISVPTCYDCIGCSSVNKDTRTQACPENCCYTMVWTENGVTNVARLCAQLNGTNCDDHCNEVSADIKNHDIKSEILQCQTCKTENCNSHPVTMPETSTATVVTVPPSNICYRCRDCGLISETTPQIRCLTNCCYETQQLDESGLVIIRGCARIVPGKQCKHYCNDIKASYCNSCNTSYCNNITLNKPITTPISVPTCYDCIGCSSVNKDTRTQACPENCCYTMVWTENGVTNVARLCAQLNGTNCDDHCNEVSADIKNHDIKSEILQCQTCKTENCNSHPVTMPETSTATVVTVPPSNICYRCRDCGLISETTPQIRCLTNCCYETQQLDESGLVIIRGCARIVPGKQCKHYCNDIKASYCNSCNTSYCNNITLNKPITTPISVPTCYDCIGCSSVNKDTRTQACPENCCYTMVWTENGVTNVARLCAQLNGTNCDDHCNEVSADIKNHDIKSEIHQCQTCKTENCNSHPVTMPEISTATVVTVPPSNICYRCRDCRLISETTPQIRCLTNCCYETQQLDESGLVIIRGCARIVPGKQCKHYCNDIKASYCNSCNTSYCNNITLNKPITTPISVPTCYDCIGCSSVNKDTRTQECPENCCYTMVWTENGVTNVARLCAQLNGTNCDDHCNEVSADIKNHDIKSEIHQCQTCKTENCNSHPVTMPEISTATVVTVPSSNICYRCRDCGLISETTPQIRCLTNCCYETQQLDESGLVIIRGCARIVPGKQCKHYCNDIKASYCNSCNTSYCNNIALNKPITTPISVPTCYDCIGCSSVNKDTRTQACPENCCYTMVWTENGVTNVARLCAQLNGTNCDDHCNEVSADIKNHDIKSEILQCQTCKTENCNSHPVTMPETSTATVVTVPPSNICYRCRDCGLISETTPQIRCLTNCCYETQQLDESGLVIIRGCARIVPGKQCKHYCNDIKASYCNSCNTSYCNNITLNKPITTPISVPTCYDCIGCSSVNKDTRTQACPENCCYTMVWTENGVTNVARLCAQLNGTNCDDHCNEVSADIKNHDIKSEIHQCQTCKTENCNSHPVTMPEISTATVVTVPPSNICYRCRDCRLISETTPQIRCLTNCCYETQQLDESGLVIIRGCARIVPGKQCKHYCNDIKASYCNSCNTSYCNNITLNKPITTPISVPTCYDCIGCSSVNKDTRTQECPENCCYTMVWTENGVTNVARLCAQLNGTNCDDHCNEVSADIKNHDIKSEIHQCQTCKIENCNSHPVTMPEISTATVVTVPPSNICYRCRDCGLISETTPQIRCLTNCCYETQQLDESGLVIIRGCARIVPGKQCKHYCNDIKASYCNSCNTSYCNNIALNKPITTPISVPTCYDCIGCSSVNKDTRTQACPENCCYTMVWTENGVTNVARLCAQLNGTNCDDHCNEVSADIKNNDIKSEIHQCQSCKTENCNSHPVTMPETSTTTVVTVAASNFCYRCCDCELISETTPQIRCPTNCCYETQQLDESGLVIIRGCARIVPGKQCKHYCNDIKASYCNSCNTSYCNNITLNKPITTPISVPTCYDCIGCSSVNKDTRTQACPENCCYTMVWTENGVTNVARLCAQLNGTNCDDHCNEVSADIKNHDIKSEIHQCQSCKTENCNSLPVTMPETSTTTVVTVAASNFCYRCCDCELISETTPQVRCPTNCCYETQQLDESGLVIIRGCARIVPGKQCKHYCNDIKSSYCNSCNTSYCNNITLNKPITTPISVPTCYDCIGCSSVNKDTRTQACPENCCYTMVWTENGVTNVARLCAQLNGTNCDDHCNEVSADIKNHDIKSEIHQCQSCKTENCNSHPVTMPETSTATVVTVPPSNICYRCRDCGLISETTPQIRCLTNCCYETQQLDESGLVIIRGCASIVPGKQCKHYCNDIKASYCNSCNTSYCNNITLNKPITTPISVPTCYDCIGCSSVNNDTRTQACPENCCYTMVWTENGVTNVARLCAQLNGTNCDDHCNEVSADIKNNDIKSEIHQCQTCKTENCNSHPVTMPETSTATVVTVPPSNICYRCRDCGLISETTPQIRCLTNCCYETQQLDESGLVIIRGCASIVPGKQCKHYCNDIKASYCNSCNTSYCNNITLNKPITTPISVPTCYDCIGCSSVNNDTRTQACPENCCYTMVWTENGVTNVARLCAQLNGTNCDDHCNEVSADIKNHDIKSEIHQCQSCKTENCNSHPVTMPETSTATVVTVPPSNICYRCRDCGLISETTPQIRCLTNCCYETQQLDESGLVIIRGCARIVPGKQCKHYCNDIKASYCNSCNTSYCNNITLNKPITTPISVPTCYDCIGCSSVNNDTRTQACPENCCYTMVWTENGVTNVARLCAQLNGTNCDDHCNEVSADIKNHDIKSEIHQCQSCKTENCNSHPVTMPETSTTTVVTVAASNFCYRCCDCELISETTPQVRCPTNCCYETQQLDESGLVIIRGCARIVPGKQCKHYCNDIKASYCNSCNTSYCNNITLNKPITTPISVPTCYDCIGCSSVNKDTRTQACPENCCYTMVWTENGVTNVARLCAKLNGTNCDDHCNEVSADIKNHDIKSEIHQCQMCKTENCNSHPVTMPETSTATVVTVPPSNICYRCRDCGLISETTPQIRCLTNCCYETQQLDESGLVIIRGCARIVPGKQCKHYCNDIKASYCNSCNTSYCNNITLNKPITTPISVPTCYDCIGCSSVNKDTRTQACPENCCYTMVWTENGVTNVARLCAQLNGTNCDDHCNEVSADIKNNDIKSEIHQCQTCKTENCNSHPVTMPETSTATVVTVPPSNICYRCRDCGLISETTPQIRCLTNCCYETQQLDESGLVIIRGCARIVPGKQCKHYCNDIKASYCNSCNTSYCNNITLNKPITTPISVPTCYYCIGCSSVNKDTRTQACPENCCYTMVWTENGVTNVARLCAQLNGTNCDGHCNEVSADIKNHDIKSEIHQCLSCKTENCNSHPVTMPETSTTTVVTVAASNFCYRCCDCELISETTPQIRCPTNCCYETQQLDESGLVIIRGCARIVPGKQCKHYCNDIKSSYCNSCNTSYCNNITLNKPITTPISVSTCYDCIGCFSVNKDTRTQACPENCCYTMVWTENGVTNVARLCAQLNGTNCDDHCNEVSADIKNHDIKSEIHQCQSCKTENCNSHRVTMPETSTTTVVTVATSTICYRCLDCELISETTPQIRCPTSCCYETQQLDESVLSISRDCARIVPGKPCKHYCNYIETTYCNSCTTNYCNNIPLNKPITTPIPIVSCYHTVGFKEITDATIIIPCPDRCCYTVIWFEHSETLHARLCAELSGKLCDDYCMDLKTEVQQKDPHGMVEYCKICKTDKCNNEQLTLTTPPTPAINCYSCDNCTTVTSKTPLIICPSECCYAALLHHNGTQMVQRRCAKIMPGRTCFRYCLHIEGTLERHLRMGDCEICTTNQCNGETFNTGNAAKGN